MKLVSFDLQSDFAFFRKPDTNNTINLSYNIIHRPAVLGILGAIVGLDGYREKGKLPRYYEELKYTKIGIEPLRHQKGNYIKTNIKYANTVGYANKGSNFLTEELTLVDPAYRIYLLLQDGFAYHEILTQYLPKGYTTYIPYLGKNEFSAWWDPGSYMEYTYEERATTNGSIHIQTIFQKTGILKGNTEVPVPDFMNLENESLPFVYFERLPIDFDLTLMQYKMADFAYSNYRIKNAQSLDNLFFVNELDAYVQLL